MCGRVARRRAVRLPSRSLTTFPPRPTIIPDGRVSRIRLEEQVLNGSLPSSPWTIPKPATGLLPPTVIGGAVVTDLQPLSAGRVSPPHPCSQGPFAPTACYCRPHCYYDPMRQSRDHQRTSRLRLYRRPLGHETFPVLTIHPSDVAATPTPEGQRRASTHLLPPLHRPSSTLKGLGAFTPHRGAERSVSGV